MDAFVGGRLELSKGTRCIELSGRAVVWPTGTSVSEGGESLTLSDGAIVFPGDTVMGGGGVLPASSIEATSIGVNGDLEGAVNCSSRRNEVVVFGAHRGDIVVQREGASDKLEWAGHLGRTTAVTDARMSAQVASAARESGAAVLDVTVLMLRGSQRAPAVTLSSTDPAAYLKHRMLGFLKRMGFQRGNAPFFVELLDDQGRFAWSSGHFRNGGMVHPREDLDACGPVFHSAPAGWNPPPCPAG